jgi:hypothetical protein
VRNTLAIDCAAAHVLAHAWLSQCASYLSSCGLRGIRITELICELQSLSSASLHLISMSSFWADACSTAVNRSMPSLLASTYASCGVTVRLGTVRLTLGVATDVSFVFG